MTRVLASVLLLLLATPAASAQLPEQAYIWKNVQIVGGGFVDGIVFHPQAPGVRYARTDIGGAYRWDAAAHRWEPLLDWLPNADRNLMGVESIAIDPQDPDRVYLACGMYTNALAPNGAILRSSNRGKTFERIDLPFKLGANEDGRGNGERLAVDPRDGRILYLGTRHDGLWRSDNRGSTWTRANSFPDATEAAPWNPDPPAGESTEHHCCGKPTHGDGIVFVQFDPASAAPDLASATQTIYAGVSLINQPNLFVTHNGGATWNVIAGEPTQYRPARAALSRDGFLYVAYGTAPGPSRMTNGAIWKLDTHTGAWTDITPDHPVSGNREFGYAAVAVDAQHPRTVIASTFGRPRSAGGDDIFRSTDGGASWKPIFASGGVLDHRLAPYVKDIPIHWLFDIEIDPTCPGHAVFTTGYGGWETFDMTASDSGRPTHWINLASGIEETVALALANPAQGAHLISGIGDYGGFVHWNLDRPPLAGSAAPPRMHNTTDIAVAALRPETIVRVGVSAEGENGENLGYSLDGGRTWKPAMHAPAPTSRAGGITVSAEGRTWVWTPEHEPTSVTRDRGATWTSAAGLPLDLRVIADPVNAKFFYAISLARHTIYRSNDGGMNFTAKPFTLAGDPPLSRATSYGDARGGQDRIYAAPGRTGDLWLAAACGLYHLSSPRISTGEQTSATFVALSRVEEIQAFGFGKAAPGRSYPTLYLAGTVHAQTGVFSSIDEGQSWTRINDARHQWGLILQISGDARQYGRVYVGTHGRGILYGDPVPPPMSKP